MTSQWWVDDDRLSTALGEALRATRTVPWRFVEAGKEAYLWHDAVAAGLAAVGHDPVRADPQRPASARTEPVPLRALTFVATRLTVELEVTDRSLVGQVVPPEPGEMRLRLANGRITTAVIDEVGFFTVRPVPSCSFRLYCRTEGGSVVTGWVTL
jgi:hypothetical protein